MTARPALASDAHDLASHSGVILQENAYAEWIELVGRVQRGEPDGLHDLYDIFAKGIRFYLCRQLGPQELDDKVHDAFLIVVQAIVRGDLREPERLMGFIRTVVRRQVAAHIEKMVQVRRDHTELDSSMRVPDPHHDPEERALFKQRNQLLHTVLNELTGRDKEILTRFYLHEEAQDRICAEMGLTETQFRLLKSRAKARFGELGRKKLKNRGLENISVRSSASLPTSK